VTDPQKSTSERDRYALPSGLIHDLRTPLNQIIGYSEMLTEQALEAGQDGYVPDLQKVRTAGQQLLALINDNFHPIRTPDTPTPIGEPFAEHATTVEEKEGAGALLEEPVVGEVAAGAGQGFLLVVDDNKANRDVLSRRLERQGHAVATAENGRQALEMLRAEAFDLVLLDIMMPEMDGYEVLQRLKTNETLRHIPVIMISALSEFDSVLRCIEMGAEDYLPKPFNPTLLRVRIGACLEKKRSRDRETLLFEQLQENHQRLKELEKLRDDLTHMTIHDLRTPLLAMILGMGAYEEMGDLNQAQREMLGIALRSGETLVGMINDLLDISKMESGLLQLELQKITVKDLIEAALKQITTLANARNLTLKTELEPTLPPLFADEDKLVRTLVNLLSNAIKFTPAGGTVTIAARPDNGGPSLLFSVSDTGEGIRSEAFGRIFEKFGQVESRLGGRTMSTGLGLAFCKLAVEAHGGHIGVESAPGQGSTFRFTIPLAVPSDSAPCTDLRVRA
jgi:two-component system sensor histidine kinase/response regulator